MSLLMEALKKAERAKQGQIPASDQGAAEQKPQPGIEQEIPTLLASDFELEPPQKGPIPTAKSGPGTAAAPARPEPALAAPNPRQAEARAQSYAPQGDTDFQRTEARERSHARSVFTAKQPAGSRKIQIAGVSLIVVAGIAGAVAFYWPTFLALIPGLAPQAALTTPRATPAPQATAPAMPPTPVPAPAPSAPDENGAQTKTASATVAPAIEKNTPQPESKKKAVRRPQPSHPSATDAQIAAGDELEPARADDSTRPPARRRSKSSRENPDIQFRQSIAAIQVNPTLSGAYQAFISGNLEMAQQQYQKFLRQEPHSRDALLGLAAIAAKQQQLGQAGAYYNKLLELDPADPDAMAGLTGVQGQADPMQSESRLKKMLLQNPQAGALYFTLGNLYSQQSRWADAQQAYFRAYSCTPGNADYAFNLAISLEHLNQGKLALDYYQRALALSQSGPANFDKISVQNRAKELQQSADK
ncbi:MAG: tetratricopeptide repeat protein [Betaproteobacteria bacterium]|nr:tetratricopeptide repeat protein [Betaproteobacteria bacterium]